MNVNVSSVLVVVYGDRMDSSPHAKRKAEDSPETHPARRACHDSADKPSPSVIGRIAEEGSINSIIRNNNPRRLFTKPIAWTSEHLQLLDCKFEFKDAQLETEDEPSRQDLPVHVQIDAPGETKRSESSKEAYSVKSALIRKPYSELRSPPYGRYSMPTISALKG